MSVIYDPSPLHPEVQNTMLSQGLPIKQVLQNGPRYAVVSTEYEDKYAIFKMVIPGASNPYNMENFDPELVVPLNRIILKEIRLLELLDNSREDLDGMTPEIYSYSTDPDRTWYLRELYRGKPMGTQQSPFRYSENFYEQVSPKMITDYFFSLHRLSELVTPELMELFPNRWPNDIHTTQLVAALDMDFNHPFVLANREAIGSFLKRTQMNLMDRRNVITHHEPYGLHTFVNNEQIGLIDWERSSLGHPLFDLSIIWTRSFNHPAWQKELHQRLVASDYLNPSSQEAWDMMILIESIAGYNHFQHNPHLDADFQAKLDAFFVDTIHTVGSKYI